MWRDILPKEMKDNTKSDFNNSLFKIDTENIPFVRSKNPFISTYKIGDVCMMFVSVMEIK